MKHTRRPDRKKPASGPSLLERINPNAAGIDCGSATHFVAVPPDRDATPVRSFTTFTTDLQRLADWLTACGVTSVAMESTGVYWIPLYEILEARGFAVVLVNARHVKNVPGRKSDVVDCQWLQELHSVGLLRGSFRPTAAIAALRAYLRHRETLVQGAATHVQRMQKALVQMNLQLAVVISDITGVTGLRIVRDIIAGQTDPHALAQHRDHRCQASEAEITAALTGHYRPEHVFVLQQNLELFDAYQRQMAACDVAIEAPVHTLAAQAPGPAGPLPPAGSLLRHRLLPSARRWGDGRLFLDMGASRAGAAPGSAEPLTARTVPLLPRTAVVDGRHRTKDVMERIAHIERPSVLTRALFKIGERMFGQVPTPERLMAHRLPLMLGIGGLYGAIEWFGTIDSQLRALLNVQVATLYNMPY